MQALAAQGVAGAEQQVQQLDAFVQLLLKWNRAYNLTAITEPKEVIQRHILDSLSVVPYVKKGRIIDVGSGGGLPGIPLAIFFPDSHCVLLDSNSKKTRFLQQVKLELPLSNVEVVHRRVEQYQPDTGFDTVISRAFATIEKFLTVAGHLCARDGRILAMKGVYPEEELKSIDSAYCLKNVHPLQVAGLDAERYLAEIIPA